MLNSLSKDLSRFPVVNSWPNTLMKCDILMIKVSLYSEPPPQYIIFMGARIAQSVQWLGDMLDNSGIKIKFLAGT
jgi:hypothetical protein